MAKSYQLILRLKTKLKQFMDVFKIHIFNEEGTTNLTEQIITLSVATGIATLVAIEGQNISSGWEKTLHVQNAKSIAGAAKTLFEGNTLLEFRRNGGNTSLQTFSIDLAALYHHGIAGSEVTGEGITDPSNTSGEYDPINTKIIVYSYNTSANFCVKLVGSNGWTYINETRDTSVGCSEGTVVDENGDKSFLIDAQIDQIPSNVGNTSVVVIPEDEDPTLESSNGFPSGADATVTTEVYWQSGSPGQLAINGGD
ncbi:MAG: hypothetical protein CL521_02955 [Actinobacteria bacterium]|nr:hypothetical protein [Actinomycetota bacterium]|tara:strand:- start:85 stop:846 length:762 start_codon:yes stop_codon:yes gene_type:complete